MLLRKAYSVIGYPAQWIYYIYFTIETEYLNWTVKKTWQDDFGDWISLTAQELSACLNSILDEKAKLDGQVRKKLNKIAEEAAEAAKAASEKPKKSKKPKKKGKGKKKKWPKLSKEEWKKKQALRKERLDELNKKA